MNSAEFANTWNIIDPYTFDRMLSSYKGERFIVPDSTDQMTYDDFIDWNESCIAQKSEDYLKWLKNLIDMIKNEDVKIMDEEPCVAVEAYKIYFDMDEKVCIVSSR